MSIKSVIPHSVKVRVKEFLGIGRLEREIIRCDSAHQSNQAQLKQIEERSASNVRLKQLEERLTSLESVAGFSKNIDLIRVGIFSTSFMRTIFRTFHTRPTSGDSIPSSPRRK